ncbi:hypothetical protein EAF04_002425 [Stromatinia cepivora]|nr:hypothetical protein EAF04_002425 [Stromatinia cepivora]
MDHNTQQNFDWISKDVLKISIPFWFGRLCSTGGELCPLAPIGCTYRPAADVGESLHASTMRAHIITHELSDCMTGKQLPKDFFKVIQAGPCTRGQVSACCVLFGPAVAITRRFLSLTLMTNHSKQDRSSVLEDIFHSMDVYFRFYAFDPLVKDPNTIALANECRAVGFVFRVF